MSAMAAPRAAAALGRFRSGAAPRPGRAERPGRPGRTWWPWTRRALTLAFFAAVAWLLVRQARTVDWAEVAATVRALPGPVLLGAAALAAASHLLYATFDLLGRRIAGHPLPTATVMAVTFVSYAFNLNMGSLIGAVASRYRLYGRLGLDYAQITQVTLFSMFTNWLGYLLLGGLAFLFFPLPLPPAWGVPAAALQAVGGVLALAALGYAALCSFSRRRSLRLRGRVLQLPSGRMALAQLAMASLNWALMGATVWVLLRGQLPYPSVLAVLLLAAVAGVLTHVPAGLGVLEAVFLALLAGSVPATTLLGVLLAYRALYYLAPLALAVPLFAAMELHHHRHR